MANEGGSEHLPPAVNSSKGALNVDDDHIVNQTGEDFSYYMPVDATNEKSDHGAVIGIGAGQTVEMVEFTSIRDSAVDDNGHLEGEHSNELECAGEVHEEEISVDQLADDLTMAYSGYLAIHVKYEMNQFEENIEEMLTRLDEFLGLVDIIRADTSLCLNQTLPRILAKGHEMEQTFERIDKLEAFVAMVKQQMNAMEEAVSQAENEMGSLSSIKKMFSSISMPTFLSKKTPAKQAPPKPKTKFEPPIIYKTDDYLILENRKTAEVSSPSSEMSNPVTLDVSPKSGDHSNNTDVESSKDAISSDSSKNDQQVAS